MSIKKEVDQCIKISNNKNITPLINKNSIKMTSQEFLELTEKQNLIHTDNLESKIEHIHKVNINLFRLCNNNIMGCNNINMFFSLLKQNKIYRF